MQPQVEAVDVIVRADGLVHVHFHFVDRLGEYSLERLVPEIVAQPGIELPESGIYLRKWEPHFCWPALLFTVFVFLWGGLLYYLVRR